MNPFKVGDKVVYVGTTFRVPRKKPVWEVVFSNTYCIMIARGGVPYPWEEFVLATPLMQELM